MNDTFVKQCCGSGIYGNPGQSIDFSGNGSQNNGNQGGSTVIDDSNYFKVSELLAELNTERKKRIARENLGILLENFATIEDLRDYLKTADLDLSEFFGEPAEPAKAEAAETVKVEAEEPKEITLDNLDEALAELFKAS